MADSDQSVSATITAQNTFTDNLTFDDDLSVKLFRVEILGSSTFTGSSVVTIQAKEPGDAAADYFDIGEIVVDDEYRVLLGEFPGNLQVRAGCKTGEFQASDSIQIRITGLG